MPHVFPIEYTLFWRSVGLPFRSIPAIVRAQQTHTYVLIRVPWSASVCRLWKRWSSGPTPLRALRVGRVASRKWRPPSDDSPPPDGRFGFIFYIHVFPSLSYASPCGRRRLYSVRNRTQFEPKRFVFHGVYVFIFVENIAPNHMNKRVVNAHVFATVCDENHFRVLRFLTSGRWSERGRPTVRSAGKNHRSPTMKTTNRICFRIEKKTTITSYGVWKSFSFCCPFKRFTFKTRNWRLCYFDMMTFYVKCIFVFF